MNRKLVTTIFAIALLIGLVVQGVAFAQSCSKCCGLSYSREGTRGSQDCPGATCYWLECSGSCLCSGNSISCGGDYPTYVDSCYLNVKCPCDTDQLGKGCYGCSYGY